MIIKRIGHIIMNVITLIHYGIKYLAIRALEVLRDSDTLRNRSTSKRSTSKEVKWDKKTAPYCETP